MKVRLANGATFFFVCLEIKIQKGMRRTLMGAGDHRFDSKICAESFDYSQRCVLVTNADLFLGSRADQCCG